MQIEASQAETVDASHEARKDCAAQCIQSYPAPSIPQPRRTVVAQDIDEHHDGENGRLVYHLHPIHTGDD